MKKILAFLLAILVLAVAVFPAAAAPAEGRQFGRLFYNGDVVRTFAPPAATPFEGRDNLYAIMGGAAGQLNVTAVAPGDPGYHGGHWAVYVVTWNVTPYLLTSEAAVLAAAAAGDVSVTRTPENDILCPVQP